MTQYARYDSMRPEWMRNCPRTKPKAEEPGQLKTPAEAEAEEIVREGTDHLHAAIWRAHPGVMSYLALNGRGTVMPPRKRA